jgi:predicted lipoprotein with Yx(FWY)xxD motif
MSRSRSIIFLTWAVAIPLVALVAAGCGGDSGGGGGPSAAAAPPKTASGQAATVGVGSGDLGKILVDPKGRTLYLFKKDSGTRSACFGACARNWPPLRSNGKPTVGSGANASMVSTTKRSDGKPQVTYNGHPLYRFQGDKSSGDTGGQGLTAFGGRWFALSPAGKQVSTKPSNSSGSSSGGSYGY